jgi:hypothetical protein
LTLGIPGRRCQTAIERKLHRLLSFIVEMLHEKRRNHAKTEFHAKYQQGDPFIVSLILLQFKLKCKYKIQVKSKWQKNCEINL